MVSDSVFAGGVKILGQSSGEKIYQSITDMYQPKNASVSRADIINEARKNIGILARNITYTLGKYEGNNIVIYSGNQDLDTTKLSALDTKATIVVYGDITISSDYTAGATILPRAIIALKDTDGNGGNISIKNSVSRLDTSLIAEKSLLSGDPSGTLYYTDLSNATGVLDKQLYVYGSIISLNTIG